MAHFGKLLSLTVLFTVGVLITSPQSVLALVGAHSYTDIGTGDVYLGGDYIEVGISSYGSFGTTSGGSLPAGFYGAKGRSNVGMSTNPTGFGVAPDLGMDFFLPGTPEERWSIGYKIAGTPTTGSNSLLEGPHDIADYAVTNQSAGDNLKATGVGTFNSNLRITQVVSFGRADKFFKNEVTLKNIGAQSLDSVRYLRSFDPDNTKDQSGDYDTQNTIVFTHQASDGKAVVVADTSNNASDPVFVANGSRSPILFYSSDSRARVSTFGFDNDDPYEAQAYDSALAKGTSIDNDQAITIAVDVGTLAAGESETFVYYTSLDNRDFSEVLDDIEEDEVVEESPADDGDGISLSIEDAAPNSGDGNGDGTKDSLQPNVTSLPNPVVGGGSYQTLEITGCDTITSISVASEDTVGIDEEYEYPLGLTDFSIDCANPGDTATIKIYYDKEYDITDWVARKFIDEEYSGIEDKSFSTAVVGSQTVTTLTYQVTDGGALDADGLVDATIIDPVGPAVAGVSAPNTGLRPVDSYPYVLSIGVGIFALAVTGTRQAYKK